MRAKTERVNTICVVRSRKLRVSVNTREYVAICVDMKGVSDETANKFSFFRNDKRDLSILDLITARKHPFEKN